MELAIAASPRAIQGVVLVIPKPLPMEDFGVLWGEYNDYEKLQAWRNAQKTAIRRLDAQKRKTGVAILGQPHPVLNSDPKFQNDTRKDSIRVGEELAQAALSTELLICRVAKVDPKDFHKYIGRSQYPRFKLKPMVKRIHHDDVYSCPHLRFWGSVQSTLKFLLIMFSRHRQSESYVAASVTAKSYFAEASAHKPIDESPLMELIDQFTFVDQELTEPVLLQLKNAAALLFAHFISMVIREAAKSWTTHVKYQLARGGGTLFGYVSKTDKAFLNVSVSAMGGDDLNPSKFLNNQVKGWREHWAPDPVSDEHAKVAILLSAFRQLGKENQSQILTPSLFSQSLKGYHKDTMGCDAWTVKLLKSLPDISKSSISDALNLSWQLIAQPHQNLVSLNACLGKPNGGIRTVSKTPMLYRIACRSDFSITHWESDNIQSYDSACKGSSSLQSAIARNFQAELAHWLGKHSAAVFNDMHKFFDSIDIGVLLQEANATDFPVAELCLALQQHLAPRVIQASGYCSDPSQVYRSILAGCKHSIAITRTLLLRLMKHLKAKFPLAPPKVHVDDTSMQSVANTTSEVQDQIAPCIIAFARGVRKLKLGLSDKGVICSSDNRLTDRLRNELWHNHDIKYKTAKHARDLGISYASGKTTPNHLQIIRLRSVKKKILKISALAATNRKARVLFSGSAYSSATYGHPACGMSKSSLDNLEVQAANCSGITRPGRCRTVALVLAYGKYGHPAAKVINETMKAWFAVLHEYLITGKEKDIRIAWRRAVTHIKKLRKDRQHSNAGIKGIMSNVISLLLNLRWSPSSFDTWIDPVTGAWTIGDASVAPHILIKKLVDSAVDIKLQEAA